MKTTTGEEVATWHVYDGQGNLRAQALLPDAFKVTQIGREVLVGIWSDSSGVEYVRAYRWNSRATLSAGGSSVGN